MKKTAIYNVDGVNDIVKQLAHYKLLAEEMQKTLEWYASDKNWGSIEELGALVSDGGERARQALKGINN